MPCVILSGKHTHFTHLLTLTYVDSCFWDEQIWTCMPVTVLLVGWVDEEQPSLLLSLLHAFMLSHILCPLHSPWWTAVPALPSGVTCVEH